MSTVPKSVCRSMEEDLELRRGPWTVEEDCVLTHYVACHGEGRWNQLSKCAGLKRTGKSCRLRWLNYLKPDVKRGNITPKEQLLILELHSMWGNRWSKIAKYLPGRTDNEIKNYWRTRVQKQAKHLKIDCDTKRFQDMIRCYWIPRLLQKMESSSPSTATMNPQSSSAPAPLLNHAHQTPPIIPQPCLNLSKPTESCNRPELNSSSEKCTNPSVSFSDSMNASQLPEVSEHPSSSHALDCVISDALQTNCYHMDSCGYGMEAFNLASTSAPGDFTNSVHCCHLAETHWADDEVANNVWNLDEFMNNFHKDLSTHSGKACLN